MVGREINSKVAEWAARRVRREARVRRVERVERVRREVRIKKETTYPYYVPLGSYLAMRLGEEGMKKLLKEVGVRTEEQLEEEYMTQIMREPGVCTNPGGPKFQTFDVEKLGEGALQRLIRGWESGLQIVTVGKGRRSRRFVEMLGMGPHSSHIITTKEQASQDTGRGQTRGVEKEVINR